MVKKESKKVLSKKKNKKNKNLDIEKMKRFVKKNKNKLVIIGLALMDIILVIWAARNNVANYVVLDGEDVFVGETKNLLLGRNYITLVITGFIYGYGLIINKILLKNKIKIKYLIILLGIILIVNMLLFYLFTKRVY